MNGGAEEKKEASEPSYIGINTDSVFFSTGRNDIDQTHGGLRANRGGLVPYPRKRLANFLNSEGFLDCAASNGYKTHKIL